MSPSRISRLFYLDEQGLRGLRGQLETWEVVGKKGKVEGAGSIEGTGKLSLKGLFSRLLGPDAELSGTAKGSMSRTHEQEFDKYPTAIVGETLEALRRFELQISTDLISAIRKASDHPNEETFFYGQVVMDSPDLLSQDGLKGAADVEVIQWQKNFGNTPLERIFGVQPTLQSIDDRDRPPMVMSMSTSKLQESLSRTGHLLTYVRGFGGYDVPFSVLANIRKTPLYFQLRPYAAWF